MERKETLREFLKSIFGKTTVKPMNGIISISGDLFSKCKFSNTDLNNYMKLLKIAFMEKDPKIFDPKKSTVADAEPFNRADSISSFFVYLESYGKDINFNGLERENIFAFTLASRILAAIFAKSEKSGNSDPFVINKEDISVPFKIALDSIKVNPIIPSDDQGIDFYTAADDCIYDTDYAESDCNYSIPVIVTDQILYPIRIKIYIDNSRKYDVNNPFFLNQAVGFFQPLHSAPGNSTADNSSGEGFYIEKTISLLNINYVSESFRYATYLDEETIINYFKTNSRHQLVNIIEEKAKRQWRIKLFETTYFKDLEKYTNDIIKRILSLDLNWLYGDDKKTLDKCNEEIREIIIGYNELSTYFDNCEEDVAVKQYLTILHHAVVEVTNYLNENKEYIASSVVGNDCSDHIKYITGIISGKKYKELVAFAKDIADSETSEPGCLGEAYYYTSSNELMQLLEAIKSYYDSLKNANKKS